jgi:hypothetical protein
VKLEVPKAERNTTCCSLVQCGGRPLMSAANFAIEAIISVRDVSPSLRCLK